MSRPGEEEPIRRPVTMADVAAAAGVHKSTVSLALRRHPSISPETADRILSVARELGYRASMVRGKINAYRRAEAPSATGEVIAHLYGESFKAPEMIEGATARARELGRMIHPFRIRDFSTGATLGRVLFNRGIRGILVSPLLNLDRFEQMRTFPWERFASVTCGIGRVVIPVNAVSINNHDLVLDLWARVWASGARRIGAAFFRQEPASHDDLLRETACRTAEAKLGIPAEERIPPHVGSPRDPVALLAWYRRWKPDAVLGLNFDTCKALREGGVAIPEACRFAGLRVLPGDGISGFLCTRAAAGRTAIDLLVEDLEHRRYGLPETRREVHLHAEWQEGTTLLASTKQSRTRSPSRTA